MKKALRITLKSLGIFILVLLVLLITLPFILKGKLETIAKKVINDNVEAVVDFSDLNVSLFKSFPNIHLSLKNLSVVGKDKFAADTLAALSSLEVSVNIMSYLKNDLLDVRTVSINNPYIHAIVLADSTANWDIAKASDEPAVPAEGTQAAESSSQFKLALRKFEIKNGDIIYEDRSSSIATAIQGLNLSLKGDMTGGQTLLNLDSSIDNLTFILDGSTMVSKLGLTLQSKIDADIDKSIYKVADASIAVNGMDVLVNGQVAMPTDDIDIDLTYVLKTPSMASLLELVPAEYMEGIKMDTKGEVSLSGWVKGVYNDTQMPVVLLDMKVKNGYIKYQGFDQAISNINIDLEALIDMQNDAQSRVGLNGMSFELAGNPFKLHAVLKHLFTDMDISAGVEGKLDFASLKAAVPMPEDVQLEGKATANINFASRMSYIEKEQYDKITLSGSLGLADMRIKMEDLPIINISKTELFFTPSKVDLKAFDATVGKSDFHMVGSLNNLLNYALKDQTLQGSLQFTSNLIDCNELMGSDKPEDTAEQAAAAEEPMSVFVIPTNIDFSLKAMINRVVFDKLDMANVGGTIKLKEGKLILSGLAMNAMGGSMDVSGDYYAADQSGALTNMQLKIRSVDIKKLATSMDFVDSLLPIAKDMAGKVSLNIDMKLPLTGTMDPDIDRLNGSGKLMADSLVFMNQESLNQLTGLLKMKQTSNTIKNINLDFTIKNGMVQVPPFDLKLGNVPVKIGGEHGVSKMDYHADFIIPTGKSGEKISGELTSALEKIGMGNIPINLANIPVGVAITGSMTQPKFALAKPKYTSGSAEQGAASTPTVQDQVKEVVKEQTEELKHQADSIVHKKADEAVDKLKDKLKKKLPF